MAEEDKTEQKDEPSRSGLEAAPSERTTTPQEVDGEEVGPVGPPHWQALVDLNRVLPCEVLPVNEDDWIKVVKIEKVDALDDKYGRLEPDYLLTTDTGRTLRGRDIHDPVLTRTLDTDASKLR